MTLDDNRLPLGGRGNGAGHVGCGIRILSTRQRQQRARDLRVAISVDHVAPGKGIVGRRIAVYVDRGQPCGDPVPSGAVGRTPVDIRLLVGQISFDSGTGGADEFSLYEYQLSGSSTIAGGTLIPIGSTIVRNAR